MRKELEKLTTKQLIELIKTFEHYPAVTLKDGKDYILSYLEDEACTISKKEIAEYLIKSGVDITKDNIHLYYEFMSDEDLKKIFNWSIMSNVFGDRIIYITDIFGWRDNKKVLKLEYWKAFDKYYVKNNDYTRFSFFGIMDTLKPIDEYISDIKNSDAFKEFEKEKQLQEVIDITNVVIIDFSKDEIEEYIDRCIIYLHNRFGSKYIVKIWETDEIYGERNDEDDYSEEYRGHSMYQGKIASFDGVFENDIKFTGMYCEVSAVFSDLLSSLEIIKKETKTKVS